MNVKRIWEWYVVALVFLVGVLLMFMGAVVGLLRLGLDRPATILTAVIGWPVLVAIGLLAVICWIINSKRPWEPDSKLGGKSLVFGITAGLLVVGVAVLLFWHSGRGTNAAQTIVLAVQTLVLAVTAGFVVWYASAAQRQAEILKDQFDVLCTPHLRPTVPRPDAEKESVIIRLTNLSGAAAIHPGVYPEWTEPHEHNAELIREPCTGPAPCPPLGGDYFTCPVIQVGETWRCRVLIPRDGSGKIKVRWLEQPWGEREKHEHIWTLEHISESGKEKEWHFVCKPEDNKSSPSS